MFKVAVVALALVALSSALPRPQRVRVGRVVGGEAAIPNEFPYVLSLQYFGSHICMASIIRADAVLTAAHCAEVGPPNSLTVKAGKHNIREIESTEQTRDIISVAIHEGYPGATGFSNDIAVLRTASPFVFNAAVAPVPIAPAGHTATGTASIEGWGATREDGSLPDILQKAELPIVSDAVCKQAFGADNVEDNMICAGLATGGVDFCTGDSGAALAATDRGYRYLAGIASWGFGCARPGYYGVYTEIAHHTDFINRHAS